jgi:hypothetical protein
MPPSLRSGNGGGGGGRGGGGESVVSGSAASSVMSWPALGVAVGSSSVSLSSAGFYPSPPHAHRHMDPLAAALPAAPEMMLAQRAPASAQLPPRSQRYDVSLRQLQQAIF